MTEDQKQPRPAERKRKTNIIMVGLPGSGKSSIGFILSKFIGFGFIDLDSHIERRQNKKVREIFLSAGEQGFRQLEKETLQSFEGTMSHVISLGGGALESQESRDLVHSIGSVVWLDTPISQIAYWLANDEFQFKKRPLLADLNFQDQDIEEKVHNRLEKLLDQRIGTYEQADMIYSNTFNTADFAARIIKKNLIDRKILSSGTGNTFTNK